MPSRDDLARRKMLGILAGTWLAQGCYALASLGIADAIGDGMARPAELAEATGTDPVALERLLRALALAGLLTQPEPDRYALTPATRLLRPDVDGSVYLNAVMQGNEVYRSFAEITHTLKTGEPGFAKVYGMGFYDYLEANPEAAHTFHASMGAQEVPPGIEGCDLTGVGTIVDVGGGDGALLALVLETHPDMRGVLAELPEAAAIGAARLASFGDRLTVARGSFFDAVPAGGDAYILSRVLHNWRDDEIATILRNTRAAMKPGARLIVLEEFLPDPATEKAGTAGGAGIVDLLMLVTQEGRDRTEAAYRALVAAAGFTVTRSGRAGTTGLTGVIEAVAA